MVRTGTAISSIRSASTTLITRDLPVRNLSPINHRILLSWWGLPVVQHPPSRCQPQCQVHPGRIIMGLSLFHLLRRRPLRPQRQLLPGRALLEPRTLRTLGVEPTILIPAERFAKSTVTLISPEEILLRRIMILSTNAFAPAWPILLIHYMATAFRVLQ